MTFLKFKLEFIGLDDEVVQSKNISIFVAQWVYFLVFINIWRLWDPVGLNEIGEHALLVITSCTVSVDSVGPT